MKTGVKIGALLGAAFFAAFGVLGGIHFGGYGAVALLSKMGTHPLDGSLIDRMVVLFGMMVGVFCAFTSSIVIGSLLGGLFGKVVSKEPVAHEATA